MGTGLTGWTLATLFHENSSSEAMVEPEHKGTPQDRGDNFHFIALEVLQQDFQGQAEKKAPQGNAYRPDGGAQGIQQQEARSAYVRRNES